MKLTHITLAVVALALASCGTVGRVDLLVTDDGKGTKHITGTMPGGSATGPLSLVLNIGDGIIKTLFPWL